MLRHRLALYVLALALLSPVLSSAQLIMLPPDADPTSSGMAEDGATPARPTLARRVAEMLVKGDYDLIDRLADKDRAQKTRVAGGGWRLQHIYSGISAPAATGDRGYPDTIARLRVWIAAEPAAITPRVALAQAYTRYAWVARGNGSGDSVTPADLNLFFARLALAHSTLDDATELKATCPQWFSVMQTVALGENWEAPQARELFDRATRYQPLWTPYYRAYANYLLPKWDGKPGDSAAFAQKSADGIAAKFDAEQGDYLYFEIGALLLGRSNGNFKPAQLDWERLQRGHAALEHLYGAVNASDSEFAHMAWRYKDLTVATPAFAKVGDRWSTSVWKTKRQFEDARGWAMAGAPALPQQKTP